MAHKPLAYLLRPTTLDEFFGQASIVGEQSMLRELIVKDKIKSLVFYGPPGSGKSTLASIITGRTGSNAVHLNAVIAKIDDLREVVKKAQTEPGLQTILVIDEIHRFNKVQQEALLPYVEDGTITMIGITTENPFFYLSKALISRSNVFEFGPLERENLRAIINRVVGHFLREQGLELVMDSATADFLIDTASGDARKLINAIEFIVDPDDKGKKEITIALIEKAVQKKSLAYDRNDDKHYDTISAFIKSVRGTAPDAAVYWCAKMLEAGEPPEFIVRRLIILASEDIGNADPMALVIATSALEAVRFVGLPEARIILSQAVTYCATAPKSNAACVAIDRAQEDIKNGEVMEVPNHLRDSNFYSKTKLGHGQGYVYPHDYPYHWFKQDYLPKKKKYYEPSEMGYEKKIKQRLEFLEKLEKGENPAEKPEKTQKAPGNGDSGREG